MMTESSTIMPSIQHDETTVKLTKPKGPMTIQKRGSVYTVILRPYNTSFQTRTLELRDKVRIRIGRHTNAKTSPTAYNGYFDSKVLSRQHAEIWCDKSKVYIKDVKSSNGTFVNGVRLSNECEESEPMELKSEDEIEFGIDIVGDNGVVMYHKVSCTTHVFPIPLSQVDDGIIKELSNSNSNNNHIQIYPDPHQQLSRKSSTSSINTLSSVTTAIENGSSASSNGGGVGIAGIGGGKRAKKLETVLTKLHAEIEKSRQVENELKLIKGTVMDLDQVFNQDKMKKTSDELRAELNKAENQIKSFDLKWKHQNQAIQTAKQELHKLHKTQDSWLLEKEKLQKELDNEQHRSKQLEQEIQQLKQNQQQEQKGGLLDSFQIKSVQILFAVLIAVISTLFYVLYN